MSIDGPNILRGRELDPQLTYQSIRQLYAELERLKQRTAVTATKPPPAPLHGSGPVTSVAQIKSLMQAGGEHYLNVQQLPGQLAEAQIPFVPIVQVLPPLNDPQSQNGSLVLLETPPGTYAQYEFDGRITPGQWVVAPTPPTVPTSAYQVLNINTTPVVVNAAITSDQTLMTYTIGAGVLNAVGKTLRLTCFGNLDELSGPTITFKIAFTNGATTGTPIVWIPNTPGTTKTNLSWAISVTIATVTTGSSGTIEPHGTIWINPSITSGADATAQLDFITGAATLDLTLAQTLKILISFNPGSASNVGRQRLMLVELLN